MDPVNNNILYAATSDGVYKTTNAGNSWTKVSNNYFVDLEFKPGTSTTLYGGTRVGHILLSTDSGNNWTTVVNEYNNSGRRVNLAVTANDPTIVYAVMANTAGGLFGIYKSTDSGSSFSKIYDGSLANHNLLGWKTDGSDAGGQGSYDLAIAVNPTDKNEVYVGGVNTHKSTDGGSNWTAVNCWTPYNVYNTNGAPVVHADKHMLRFRAGDNTLFETNDGGVYTTSDGGSNWTDHTNGIEPSQIYRLSVAQTTSDEFLTGLQDNGTKIKTGGNWQLTLGGDGAECLIDYSDINIQYASYTNGNIKRTTNHWSSSTGITRDNSGNPINGLTETGYWVTPYVIDPNNHSTLYLGLNNVWKSTDQGSNWTKISSMNSTSKIRSLAVAPSNSQVIYASDPSHLWKTVDGGANWSDITGTLPVANASITYVTVKHNDSATVWVSMGQYNSDGVYQTTDAGNTWTNISAGLPEAPVMCVIQNKAKTNETELYAGTDVGVYVKVGNANWQSFSNDLPNVIVNELEIYYDETQPALSRIRAATSGRGLWESELYTPANMPPTPAFTADKRIPSTTDVVNFTDLSSNAPTFWQWKFSPNTVTFTNGTDENTQNPSVIFNNQGFYLASLVASNVNGSDSIIRKRYIHVLDYCSASGGGDTYIDRVNIGSIYNDGTGDDGYADYSNLSTQLKVSNPYSATIHFGSAYYHDTVTCWIDWNQDGDFNDQNEECFAEDVASLTETGTIVVPIDAKIGFTRMRIRLAFQKKYTPCGNDVHGEVEDYAVEVIPEENVWIGNTTEWNSSGNWSKGIIPTSSYNVTIPSAPSGGNFPVIPAGSTVKCNQLILENNATITVNGQLEVNQQ